MGRPGTTSTTEERITAVRTMTCQQLGGPCDRAFHARSANEAIEAQDSHLEKSVAGGDETHRDALKVVQGRWENPVAGWAGTGRPSATSRRCRRTE